MRGFWRKRKSPQFLLSLANIERDIFVILGTVLILIGSVLFFYFGSFNVSQPMSQSPASEQVARDDNKLTRLRQETLSEDLRLLDRTIEELEDRYRKAVLDVWLGYQSEPDNFLQIREIIRALSQVNVPFLYQSFHLKLISALRMKEEALTSGNLVVLQKAEREITFLENASFL